MNDEAITIRPLTAADVPAAKAMMLTVAAGIFAPEHPAATFVNRHSAAMSDVDDFRAQYSPPGGWFLVVMDGETLIGTGAIRRIDESTAELRRMWLLPAYHGRGIGYRLIQELFAFARAAGYRLVRLSTSAVQERAIGFYTRLGFYPIPPYRATDDEVFLEIALGPEALNRDEQRMA
jgi:putative acetyltransferase